MKAKKMLFIMLAATLALFVALPYVGGIKGKWAGDAPVFAQGNDADAAKRTITVSGVGELKVEPDVAYISVGIQNESATANEAQTANANAFAGLQKTLGNYAIDKKDIKTTNFSVQPQYQYSDKEKPKIVGYIASHMIEITYRKLDKLGVLLDDVSKAGANRVNNIQFATEKQQDYELQALEKAMANARAKADVLAKNAGGAVKGVLSITQNASGGSPQIYTDYARVAMKAMADEATSISTGQLTINASATVQFEF